MKLAKELKVTLTTTDELLGMMPTDKELHETYIASKAPDAMKIEEEIEAVGVDDRDGRGGGELREKVPDGVFAQGFGEVFEERAEG